MLDDMNMNVVEQAARKAAGILILADKVKDIQQEMTWQLDSAKRMLENLQRSSEGNLPDEERALLATCIVNMNAVVATIEKAINDMQIV